jgi:hypothetical protein
MLKRFATFFASIARESAGTSLIETAIILPTILMLLAGVSDLAMGFSAKLRTQQAAARTIEYATTAGLERLSVDELRNEAATAANVPSDQVTVLRWLECSGAKQAIFDSSCEAGQEIARYVSIRIADAYEPILGPLLPKNIAVDGSIEFVGFSSVRLQ